MRTVPVSESRPVALRASSSAATNDEILGAVGVRYSRRASCSLAIATQTLPVGVYQNAPHPAHLAVPLAGACPDNPGVADDPGKGGRRPHTGAGRRPCRCDGGRPVPGRLLVSVTAGLPASGRPLTPVGTTRARPWGRSVQVRLSGAADSEVGSCTSRAQQGGGSRRRSGRCR